MRLNQLLDFARGISGGRYGIGGSRRLPENLQQAVRLLFHNPTDSATVVFEQFAEWDGMETLDRIIQTAVEFGIDNADRIETMFLDWCNAEENEDACPIDAPSQMAVIADELQRRFGVGDPALDPVDVAPDETDLRCPTCGNMPGDGAGCDDPDGCGYGKSSEPIPTVTVECDLADPQDAEKDIATVESLSYRIVGSSRTTGDVFRVTGPLDKIETLLEQWGFVGPQSGGLTVSDYFVKPIPDGPDDEKVETVCGGCCGRGVRENALQRRVETCGLCGGRGTMIVTRKQALQMGDQILRVSHYAK